MERRRLDVPAPVHGELPDVEHDEGHVLGGRLLVTIQVDLLQRVPLHHVLPAATDPAEVLPVFGPVESRPLLEDQFRLVGEHGVVGQFQVETVPPEGELDVTRRRSPLANPRRSIHRVIRPMPSRRRRGNRP